MIRTKSVDGKPTVLPGEHVGGGRGVEQASESEPPDHAATHPLGERGQVSLGDWPRWQERRRGVSACFGSSWHEDTVGCAHMQMHMMVEHRSEAMQEGDATEPRAGGSRYVGIRGPACRREQEPFDLIRVPLETRAPPPCFPILRPLPAGAMMRPPDKEAAWISSNGRVAIGAGSLA